MSLRSLSAAHEQWGQKLKCCMYNFFSISIYIYIYIYVCVTLDHKTSLKYLEFIYINSQKYIVWVKMIDFYFMPKIIKTLSKDHVA